MKEIYNSDIGISEAAIRASGSLGNEIAIPHLYQIVERGKQSQRVAAVQSLTAIRAPSSTAMLVKYFNHFPEEELRTEILQGHQHHLSHRPAGHGAEPGRATRPQAERGGEAHCRRGAGGGRAVHPR